MTEEKKDSKKCSGKKNIMFAYGFIQLGSSFVSAIALAAIAEKSSFKENNNQNYESKNMNTIGNLKKKKNKDLPWWVELLFVQIGLPEKLLIKILKTKKNAKELIKNEKKSLITLVFIMIALAYFYPIIKHSKSKLDCEKTATNYIIKNKRLININKMELKMLSTNFCNGGEEIYEIENSNL